MQKDMQKREIQDEEQKQQKGGQNQKKVKCQINKMGENDEQSRVQKEGKKQVDKTRNEQKPYSMRLRDTMGRTVKEDQELGKQRQLVTK